jgi:hypothetical protein
MTGVHRATVAFSVRNVLAQHGAAQPTFIAAVLRQRWDSAIEESEVVDALTELEKRGFVRRTHGGTAYAATSPHVFQVRAYAGNVELGDDDERAWEGWAACLSHG